MRCVDVAGLKSLWLGTVMKTENNGNDKDDSNAEIQVQKRDKWNLMGSECSQNVIMKVTKKLTFWLQ